MNILYDIKRTLEDDGTVPFQILRGFQASIGEKMSVGQQGSMGCMGYALFWKEWTAGRSESSFRAWFNPLEDGIEEIKHTDTHRIV